MFSPLHAIAIIAMVFGTMHSEGADAARTRAWRGVRQLRFCCLCCLALLKHCSRFMVDREETGADGVLYLKLADGRGGSDIVRW